jgi:hypothetical protein
MTRRRLSAWPTIVGSIALFAVVFQLLLFQATPGGLGSLVNGVSLGGENESFGDDGAPAKSISVAPTQQAPVPVVSTTS